MAIVWPCPLSVEKYVESGRSLEVPRPECPECRSLMIFWSGYFRPLRHAGGEVSIFVPRARCKCCRRTHALLPAFLLYKRLYEADVVGAVIAAVIRGASGVRPASSRSGVLHETARGWVRRFRGRADSLAVAFAALATDLGRDPPDPVGDAGACALSALTASYEAACQLPGWLSLTCWRFASAVSGGRLICANTTFPYLVVGKRRFMPPVPRTQERKDT